MNCIVQKLKDSVSNNNLSFLDAVKFQFKEDYATKSPKITVGSYSASDKIIYNALNCKFTNQYLSSGADLERYEIGNTNGAELSFKNLDDKSLFLTRNKFNIAKIDCRNVVFTLDELNGTRIKNVSLLGYSTNGNNTVYCKDSDVFSKLNYLEVLGLYGNINLHFDIQCFSKNINLKQLLLSDCINVSGSITSLLNSLYSNGKTSGALTITAVNTQIGDIPTGGQLSSTTATFSTTGWTV